MTCEVLVPLEQQLALSVPFFRPPYRVPDCTDVQRGTGLESSCEERLRKNLDTLRMPTETCDNQGHCMAASLHGKRNSIRCKAIRQHYCSGLECLPDTWLGDP